MAVTWMDTFDLNLMQFDAAKIIQCCRDEDRHTISGPRIYSTEVIEIGKRIAVKFGWVDREEAWNQIEAFQLLDPSVVRVPTVYAFFEDDDDGYIVMEYIDDFRRITASDMPILTKALKHMHALSRDRIGPLCGGAARGDLWPDDVNLRSATKASLQYFLNTRLLGDGVQIDMSDSPLVFCHLDLAPRNISLSLDGVLCIIDWEAAGFYPRYFELAALRLNMGDDAHDNKFNFCLQTCMMEDAPFSASELGQAESLDLIRFNCIRYAEL